MRNSDWNSRNPQTYHDHNHDHDHRHHHHRYSQTTSLSPLSSDHTTALLPNTRQYSKSGWTYGLDHPCIAECSRSSENADSNLHIAIKAKTASFATSKIPISIRHNDLDYTTGSSSITSSTTVSENLHRKLIGVPFITTTSWFLQNFSN